MFMFVYWLIDNQEIPRYVGITADPIRRFRVHRQRWPELRPIVVAEVSTKEAAQTIEMRHVAELPGLLNRHPGGAWPGPMTEERLEACRRGGQIGGRRNTAAQQLARVVTGRKHPWPAAAGRSTQKKYPERFIQLGREQGAKNAAKPGYMAAIGRLGSHEDKVRAGKLGAQKRWTKERTHVQ